MSDFFKSALGLISGSTPGREENDFVGQVVELGNQKLRVKRKIAEGGFAFVFVAQDNSSGKEFALKRLLANDEEKTKAVVQEIKFLKKLTGHPNIVQFISAASIGKEESGHGQAEFLLLMELCTGGQVVDVLNMRDGPLPIDVVLKIFYQSCKAVQHMHAQSPPIIHRDLKVENLLISTGGMVKLCDFGSATTETHSVNESWSAMRRSLVEDEALGCVLFMLCFGVHPYEDSAKLRIINANYQIPEDDKEYTVFHDLIMGMFQVDPRNRPTIKDIIERLEEIAEVRKVKLTAPLPQALLSNVQITPQAYNAAPSSGPSSAGQQTQDGAGSLFSSFKIGAGNLMKNVKDASAKVVETVSLTMNKGDLDISFITSRVAVMSFPAEGVESAIKNHIDDVRTYLEGRHRGCYAVYNLSQRQYRNIKFENRVSDCGWPIRKAPSLANLFAICKNMHLWLRQNPKNICVVHCLDGKASSATVAGAFLVFCRLFDGPQQALTMFSNKRCSPEVSPSQRRYIEYMSELVGDKLYKPHNRPVILNSITMAPVPLFNKMKNGCTPFVEVYVGEDRILSTSQEYEKIKGFSEAEGKVTIPLNVSATGDITITVYHARSTFGGKIQGKITSMKMFQFQIHTGFVMADRKNLRFTQYDLDQLDTPDKYPERFTVTLNTTVSPKDRPPEQKLPWDTFDISRLSPKILFSNKEEMSDTMADFGSQSSNDSPQHVPSEKPKQTVQSSPQNQSRLSPSNQPKTQNQSKPRQEVPTANFFETLEWNNGGQDSANVNSEPVQETKVLTEAETGLLGSMSDDEEDFASFGQQRMGGSSTDVRANKSASSLIDVEPSEQNSDNAAPQSKTEDVDFFNMNSGDNLANNIDLMHIDKTPSNVDLLGGAEVHDDIFGSGSSGKKNENSFDPFQAFDNKPKQNVPPVKVTAPEREFHAFDPFADLNGTKEDSSSVGKSKATTDSSGDLMGDWNSFVSTSSSPNLSRNNSSSNLQGGSGNIPNVASSGSFQQMGMGANIPRNNSGTFRGMQSGVGMSSNNSGTFQPMGGMGQAQGLGKPAGPSKPADPFADFGGFGKASPGPMNQQPSSKPVPQGGKPPMGSGYKGGLQQPWQQQQQPPKPKQQPPKQTPGAGQGPRPPRNAGFEDLLPQDSTFTKKDDGPKTIGAMKKKVMAEEMDPIKLQVMEWTKGKERNIRALLCSLHTVLWEDEKRWKQCGMHDLVSADQLSDSPHLDLAREVFVELNDAWAQFEEEGMKSLY
ncbi:GAK-like protein [Mya arenaria]|uniref:GAK-like protein n=1 Tax=Mya arenaria TaxID=6604 RepID=A0ABY7FMK6_MYAAR|nr:GAK-like protein [Mya arenaria]